MAGTNGRYTVGNLIGVLVAILLCALLAGYALFGNPTNRIGRNAEAVAVFGVVGIIVGLWYLVKGIRSRR